MLSFTASPDSPAKSRHPRKTFLHTLFFILLISQTVFPQLYQQTSGTTMGLPGVYFTNENTGIAVGDNGTILRTTNWRTNWTEQNAAM